MADHDTRYETRSGHSFRSSVRLSVSRTVKLTILRGLLSYKTVVHLPVYSQWANLSALSAIMVHSFIVIAHTGPSSKERLEPFIHARCRIFSYPAAAASYAQCPGIRDRHARAHS
jgi:hypothetical protein